MGRGRAKGRATATQGQGRLVQVCQVISPQAMQKGTLLHFDAQLTLLKLIAKLPQRCIAALLLAAA